MKRILAFVLALTMVISFAACAKKTEDNNADASGSDKPAFADCTALLSAVWNTYGDDEKFAVMGGDFDNIVENAPGKYSLESAEMVDSSLGLPADAVAKVNDAASVIHMMNANTFTCAAFRAASADDTAAVVDALKTNILARQWMCGFPDKLVIITSGEYVISVFGNEELVNTFVEKTKAAVPGVQVVCDEPIV